MNYKKITIFILSILSLASFFLGACNQKNNLDNFNANSTQDLVINGQTAFHFDWIGGTFQRNTARPIQMPAPYIERDTEVRAVWVTTVWNLDMPGGMNQTQFRNWFNGVLNTVEMNNMNTILFQTRPFGDAFYESALAPWSRWIWGGSSPVNEGRDPGWDMMRFMIDASHARGIEFHAWKNPYRIATAPATIPAGSTNQQRRDIIEQHKINTLNNLHPSNWARQNPQYVTTTLTGSILLDPGQPAVQQHVTDVVAELFELYPDIDGVHFDDYFYLDSGHGDLGVNSTNVPGALTDNPNAAMANNANTQPIDLNTFITHRLPNETLFNFRVRSVNQVIEKVFNVHEAHYELTGYRVRFGVSPSGIWSRTSFGGQAGMNVGNGINPHLQRHFADSVAWIRNGWIHYFTPQVYWSFGVGAPAGFSTPFAQIIDWWAEICARYGVALIPGLEMNFANLNGNSMNSWNEGEIANSIMYMLQHEIVKGAIMFRLNNIQNPPVNQGNAPTVFHQMQTVRDQVWTRPTTSIWGEVDRPGPVDGDMVFGATENTLRAANEWNTNDLNITFDANLQLNRTIVINDPAVITEQAKINAVAWSADTRWNIYYVGAGGVIIDALTGGMWNGTWTFPNPDNVAVPGAASAYTYLLRQDFSNGQMLVVSRELSGGPHSEISGLVRGNIIRINDGQKPPLSSNNTITNINVSGFTLNPVFNQAILNYSLTVPFETTSISINATTQHVRAILFGTGAFNLEVGTNTFIVYAVAEDDTKGCEYIIVVTRLEQNIPVTEIIVSGPTVGYVGDTLQLNVLILPSNATNQDLEWFVSSGPVSVSQSGLVTLNGVGSAVVRARIGNVTSNIFQITINQVYIPVTSIEISGDNNGYIGDEITLSAIVLPSNATNKTVTWSVNNHALANINQNGVVTLLAAGTVIISASADGITKTHEIAINPVHIPVTSIEISGDNNGYIGDEITLSAIVLPNNATNKTITWTVNNHALATINQNGVVTLLSAGTVIISASADGITKTHEIVINKTNHSNNEITNIVVINRNIVPNFNASIHEYTLNVGSTVNQITIVVTTADVNATVTGDGTHELLVGTNTIEVFATAVDGNKGIVYTITVVRASATGCRLGSSVTNILFVLVPIIITGAIVLTKKND